MIYDLEKRTKDFSREVVVLLNSLRFSDLNKNMVSQLIRSATSIGANYHEANGGSSVRDFRNKTLICLKEARETKYWIEILACVVDDEVKNRLRLLWKEAHELVLIFAAIKNKVDGKQ